MYSGVAGKNQTKKSPSKIWERRLLIPTTHTRNMRRPSWHSCLRVSLPGCMQLTPEGVRRRPARGDAVGVQNSLVTPHPAFLFLIFTNPPSYHQKVTTEQNSWNCGTRESTRELTEDSSGKPLKTCPVSPDRFCVEATNWGAQHVAQQP